jgi:hypothetical protein
MFKFLDGNIFEPSFGTPEGRKKIYNYDYSSPVAYNARFNRSDLYEKYDFNCTLNGTTLTCVTPAISSADIPSFSSEQLKFTNNDTISSKYIIYGRKFVYLLFKRKEKFKIIFQRLFLKHKENTLSILLSKI